MIRRFYRTQAPAFATITLLLFVVACGGATQGSLGAGPATQAAPSGDGQSVVVVITNRTATALTARSRYNQGSAQRIGTVTENRRRAFSVSWRDGELQILVRGEAGGVWLESNEITVSPSDSLELLVTNFDVEPQLLFRGKRQ